MRRRPSPTDHPLWALKLAQSSGYFARRRIIGGTIDDTGALSVSVSSEIENTTVNGGGYITVSSGQVLTLDAVTLDNVTVSVSGTLLISGSSEIEVALRLGPTALSWPGRASVITNIGNARDQGVGYSQHRGRFEHLPDLIRCGRPGRPLQLCAPRHSR